MNKEESAARTLSTPRRPSRSPSRRSGHRSDRSHSRSRRLLEQEEALKREQDRVRLMERNLQKSREDEQRRRRSERRSGHKTATRRETRSRSRSRSHSRSRSRKPYHHKRSCSPSFSSKDLIEIIQSIKEVLPSQPSNQNTQSMNNKNIIPEFNPSAKSQRMDIWLKKVNECATVYGWDERTIIHFAMQKLSGLAKTWYESLSTILFTWDEWQVKLLNAFPCEQNYGQLLEDMLRRKSRFNELIENYFYEKLALLNQCEITGRRAVDCIIHGISDRTMRSSALALRCEEPDQLLKFLLSNNKEIFTTHQTQRDKNSSTVDDRAKNKSTFRTNPGLYCYNCKEKGHPFARCPKPLLKCIHCDRVGHKPDECRFKQGSGTTRVDTVAKTMRISTSNLNNKFIKEVSVEGVPLEALVDLGSEVTLIKESVFEKLGFNHNHTPSSQKGFGDCIVTSLGSSDLNLTIDGVSAIVSCRVVKDNFLEKQMLVGQTYSEQRHIAVYKDFNKLQFLHIGNVLPDVNFNEDVEPLQRVRMVAHNELFGVASVKAATEIPFTGSALLETKIVGKPGNQYVVCGGVYDVKDGMFYVMVTPCSIPCRLQKNYIFSRAEKVDRVHRLVSVGTHLASTSQPETSSPKQFNESEVHIGDAVPDHDKEKLINLLRRFEDCFAHDLNDLGSTNVAEMKIELSSQKPVVYRPYRLSHYEREKVRGMIDEMLQAGIIRESTSNYCSPIILVRKKDGNVRLCVDFRKLNSITVKERYPIPVIEDEISRLSGQAWFITLDLMSGYYQVPIAEGSKHLTSFVTPDGQYEYNRMPFGLANAPAIFQRMMNHVLGPARFNKATVYIDDLLIFGQTSAECIGRLEEVLILLRKANLKLNLTKCSFLKTKIDYLGYEIGSEGMRPGKAKIQSVENFPRPENVHGVRQFLGLVSYFRKFIYSFAQLASPLTKLLKKNAVWEWTNDQEESFKILKAKLLDRPVLALYDPLAETELHTDASRIGIGGILLQCTKESEGVFHPVAYFSRQTTPEEKNFHSYELETLAVICSLNKFRVFLLGKAFKVVTDCSALRSTFEKRDLIPRIARWWLALQEFECSIEYRAGSKMGHVDALSRNPVSKAEPCDPVQSVPSVMVISDQDWLQTLQMGDSELSRIRDIVSSNLDSKGLEYIKDNYVLKDDKLFRCVDGNKDILRWVVPKGARWQLCRMNHDDIGHVGFEKTYERIKKNYWFNKMKRFVKKYVSACIDCAYAKKTTNQREGLLHSIEKVGIPFHTLHIDHLGPFVKSRRGFTHILTVVDSFTKFLFIKLVRNTNTQNVIRALEDIFDTFRNPDRLVSDRGSCFTSNAFRRFCLDRGIKHVLNAVACPRSNGQVERYNRTILDSLTAQNLRDNEKNWDDKIGRIQWGLNNTLQKTIGRTPAEVMFGTMMNSEVNPALNEISEVTREVSDLPNIRAEVKDSIDKAQVSQKHYYDQGRRPARTYKKGDLIKVTKTVFQNDGKSTKLMPSYEGPFKVEKVLGNDRYKVAPIKGFEGMKNKRKTTVAADRMQPWIHVASLEIDDDNENSIDTYEDIHDDVDLVSD